MPKRIEEKPEDVLYDCADQWFPEYKVRVVRTGECIAKLTVSFNGRAIHKEDVSLSYGAKFGPDMMDIHAWGHIACRVTDAHLHKRGISAQPPQ